MNEEYTTLREEAVGEITEKKSRFIATVVPVETEQEALDFIAAKKKEYWDARHNCSAYIIREDKPLERCSDDGEPSRTAGMPMLEVLKGAGLSNVCCVVTRYFGGVLLGTGGLVRAYQGAVSEALSHAVTITHRLLNEVVFTLDYTAYGKLQYLAAADNLFIADTAFTDNVAVTLMLDDEQLGSLSKKMCEATSGACIIEVTGKKIL